MKDDESTQPWHLGLSVLMMTILWNQNTKKRRHQNRPQDPRRGGVGIFRNENDGRRHKLRSHAERFEPRQKWGVGRRSTIHAAVQ